MKPAKALVVLVSGSGSNLQSIIDACASGAIDARIHAVISNVPDAYALERARHAGIDAQVVDHREFQTREAFDIALAELIESYPCDAIVMAGFMRVLTTEFFDRCSAHIVNIHPALLPDYPGLNTHSRALADGASWHGASVHFVIPELDAGPVIVRAAVKVLEDDTPEQLAARVLKQEHRIYPLALTWLSQGRLSLVDGHVLLDGEQRAEQQLGPPSDH